MTASSLLRSSCGATLALAAALSLGGCAKNGQYTWVAELPPDQGAAGEYQIAVGDTVSLHVFGQDNLTTRARVRTDGRIALPFLGDVEVRGKTPAGLSRELETRFKEYMVSPKVTIALEESQASSVAVVGEVSKPGAFPVDGQTGVLQALALAGGLTEYASKDSIYVLRRAPQQRIRFTYASLIHGDQHAAGFRLRSGDVVVVELGRAGGVRDRRRRRRNARSERPHRGPRAGTGNQSG